MKIITEHPIALDSDDHKFPRGIRQDNTHCPKFVEACKRIYRRPAYLDLGCAGGGLVLDFREQKLVAFGIDGSDYALKNNLGEWNALSHRLFLADITKPFYLVDDHEETLELFEIIGAWDVLEHIKEEDLPQVFENVQRHLTSDGIFTCSISTIPDESAEAKWHVTVHDYHWWWDRFRENGFEVMNLPFFKDEFPRGSGNPLATGDWSGIDFGFHVVARPK